MSQTQLSIPDWRWRTSRPALRVLLRWAIVSTAPFAMGCPSPNDAPDAGPAGHDYRNLEVVAALPRSSGLAAEWRIAVGEWETDAGAVCRLNEIDLSGRPDLLPQVSQGTTLLVAPLPLVPELVDAAWLAPLDPVQHPEAAAVWQDIPAGLRQGPASPGRQPALIPLDCPVLACYYRADLLQAAGREPPTSWQDYQQLLDSLNEWAPGLAAVEPWHPDFRTTIYIARAASYALHPDNLSLYVDLETGRPLIGEPPFVQALEAARTACERLDPRSLNLTPADCFRELAAGRAALAIGAPVIDGSPVERAADIRIGVAPLPGAERVYHRELGKWVSPADGQAVNRVTLVGFDGLAVCVSALAPDEAQRAAWNLFASIDAQAEIAGSVARPARRLCRASAADDLARNPPPRWPVEEWREQVRTVAGMLESTRVVSDLPLPHRWEFRDRLTARLSEALDGSRSAEEALQLAATDWQALIEQLGARRVRNVCRQCSGLSALPPE
jgi:ABC-type glycerol-3-phosphate transport system substrate-binding protein